MTYAPTNSPNAFVESSIFLPDDAHQQTLKLTDSLRDHSSAINVRDIAQYYLNEINSGGQLYGTTPQKGRQIFRKVIQFGALPNSTSKSVAHGISITNTFQFIKLMAIGNNPNATGTTPYAIAIPDQYSTITLTNTNAIVTTTADYSAYTNCAIIVEYSKV